MLAFDSFSGTVAAIENFQVDSQTLPGCVKLVSIISRNSGQVNFVVEPSTYFVNGVVIRVGDNITGFHDTNVPVPLIYPPQYRAVVMSKNTREQIVMVDRFNDQLINSDGTLQLHISRFTRVSLTNGQPFTGTLVNRNLVIVYSSATKSIPAQTTPHQVIVLCR